VIDAVSFGPMMLDFAKKKKTLKKEINLVFNKLHVHVNDKNKLISTSMFVLCGRWLERV
jgi:hypothetical protein